MTTDERAIRLQTARQRIVDLLVFSTLRYYAQACQAVRIDAKTGAVQVNLLLEVPASEIHDALWMLPTPTPKLPPRMR